MIVRYDALCPAPPARLDQALELLCEAFPPHERRSDESQRSLTTKARYKQDLLIQDERVMALMFWWDLDGFRFVEHFAVRKNARGGGVGGEMLAAFLAQSAHVVLEAELPESEIARRRLGFYARHGFCASPRDYFQLPLRPGDSPMPMRLLFCPALPDEAEFERVRHEIYHHVYNKQE